MNIEKVHIWKKVLQNDTVDHVEILYSEDSKTVNLHEYGENAIPAPEFFAAIENFSEFVVAACSLPEELTSAIKVRSVSIKQSEDKDFNNNSKYTVVSSLKAGNTTATLTIDVNHKYIPEGFEENLNAIVEEAKEYINGKRNQVEMNFDEDMNDDPESSEEEEIQPDEDSYNGE